jgi:eukaryotic-like serine/threonine-protein kinase
MTIRAGKFELLEIIGAGAMGEVWRGVHVHSRVEVALKVMTRSHARDPAFVAQFWTEVRAMAGLDHPCVITLFDAGELTGTIDHETLTAGSPYLAMEFAPHGALREQERGRDWPTLQTALLDILDGLAHAHARGVIHRDLKPDNVLVTGAGAARRLKLTDFGIAHVMWREDRTGNREASTGTPDYMAPEQIEGRWRDYGPWTDLYALGCVAFELATGDAPYGGESFWQIAFKHLRETPPELLPRFAVPDGFAEWVSRLLNKPEAARFVRAADAAWALRRLGDPVEVGNLGLVDSGAHDPVAFADTIVNAPTPGTLPGLAGLLRSPLSVDPPPTPASWRRPARPRPSMQMVGTGLGLLGLRTPRAVGRSVERDVLWAQLLRAGGSKGSVGSGRVATDEHTGARAVILTGAAGVGKTYLATWLAQRAHEMGAAETLGEQHGQGGGQADLRTALRRRLRCGGLDGSDLLARIRQRLDTDDDDAKHIASYLQEPTGEGDVRRTRSPAERYAIAARLVEEAVPRGGKRPVILVLDDVHQNPDDAAFAQFFLKRQTRHPSPVLLVLTARQEELAAAPAVAALLKDLAENPRVVHLGVDPLDSADRRELVEELLRLSGPLALEVAERCAGNPMFAVQLVSDWVERGLLRPDEHGFVLTGAKPELPDDVYAVWRCRVGHFLATAADPTATATLWELAACLGVDVPGDQWRAAARAAFLPAPDGLEAALLTAGFARKTPEGWAFAQPMLRETLLRRARETGHHAALHRACASVLERDGALPPDTAARLGLHLLEAGEPEPAAELLECAVDELLDAGEFRAAATALDDLSRALAGAEPGRQLRAAIQRARILIHRGALAEAAELAEQVVGSARGIDRPDLAASALLSWAHATRLSAETQRARELYGRAEAGFLALEDAHGVASCLRARAQMRGPGSPGREERTRLFEEARSHFSSAGDEVAVADCTRGLGQLAQARGDHAAAKTLTSEALRAFQEQDNILGVALCVGGLAELARYRGDLEGAETGYRQALAAYERIGSASAMLPQLNLGLILLLREDYAAARRVLDAARRELERSGRRAWLAAVHANLLPCAAAAGDWAAFDHHLSTASLLLNETGMADDDIAWTLERAAELAAEQPERAAAAAALAATQRRALAPVAG